MAEIKDKVITVESLKALHDYNKDAYITKENPVGTGSLSMNRKRNTTIGVNSVTEGFDCTASAPQSHAEGSYSIAEGRNSHAEGNGCKSLGESSHAEGWVTKAEGDYSHAEGHGTSAMSDCQHVQGRYNISDSEGKYLHIVGNGTVVDSMVVRSNAHTLDWDGNAWYAGDITAEGNMILTASQYGDELPAAGVAGRIFFKKLSE